MDLSKEIWHCELYKLQQQSPAPKIVKCNKQIDKQPIQYGDEYHGNIDRTETDAILSNYGNGAFLIRDSQRNAGAFTLVIRFDEINRNYVLYYNVQTCQHFVGSKYFDNIIDLVQDGLIHMYIESRGADILRKIAEAQVYEATPFYRTKCYTIQQHEKIQQRQRMSTNIHQVSPSTTATTATTTTTATTRSSRQQQQQNLQEQHRLSFHPSSDFNGSCDSGIFNSLRSSEPGCGIKDIDFDDDVDDPDADLDNIHDENDSTFVDGKYIHSNRRHSQISVNTLCNQHESEIPPIAPPRRKSLYSNSSSNNSNQSHHSHHNHHYEPIFEARGTSTNTPKPTDFHLLEKCHSFRQYTFVGPQWCDFCAHFMWGLVMQGVRCNDCGFQAHRKCGLKAPADCIPRMDRLRRLFGVELTGLAKMDRRAVPQVLTKLVESLETRGLTVSGLYRVSGNLEMIEEIRTELDKDLDSVNLENDSRFSDIHNLTGLIKLFLRQLPIPLINVEIYSQLLKIIKLDRKSGQLDIMFRNILSLMHSVYFATLEFFIRHLNKVSKFSSHNRMDSANLAIVFAPTLIAKSTNTISSNSSNSSSQSSVANPSPDELMSMIQSNYKWDLIIIQSLIENCDKMFSQNYDNINNNNINNCQVTNET